MNRISTVYKLFSNKMPAIQYKILNRSYRFPITFFKDKSMQSRVASRDEFFQVQSDRDKNKALFMEIVARFKDNNPSRKGHVEFIQTALKYMKEFEVHADMDVYRELFDLFPTERMVPKNLVQAAFYHFPYHQDTAIMLMEKMSENGLIPDRAFRKEVISRFGYESLVFQKLGRMRYWGSKFRYQNTYPVPFPTPKDPLTLAKIGMTRMAKHVDRQMETTVFQPVDLPEEAIDRTWIVSNQAPTQRRLLAELKPDSVITVEGPTLMWLREAPLTYFTLVAPAVPREEITVNADDVRDIRLWMFGEERNDRLDELPTVHEQTDGTILATVATGSSSRDSLLSWIRLLQRTNPKLAELAVVFQLRAPSKDLAISAANWKNQDFEEAILEEAKG